jgi:hypothetical protein
MSLDGPEFPFGNESSAFGDSLRLDRGTTRNGVGG